MSACPPLLGSSHVCPPRARAFNRKAGQQQEGTMTLTWHACVGTLTGMPRTVPSCLRLVLRGLSAWWAVGEAGCPSVAWLGFALPILGFICLRGTDYARGRRRGRLSSLLWVKLRQQGRGAAAKPWGTNATQFLDARAVWQTRACLLEDLFPFQRYSRVTWLGTTAAGAAPRRCSDLAVSAL